MRLQTIKQLHSLLDFMKTLPVTDSACVFQNLLQLQIRNLVVPRKIVVNRWPLPQCVIVHTDAQQMAIQKLKMRNSVYVWTVDPQIAQKQLQKELDWSQSTLLSVFQDDLVGALKESLDAGGHLKNKKLLRLQTYAMFGQFTPPQLPEGFCASKLKPSEARFADSKWKYTDEISEGELLYEMQHLPNICIRDISGDLVAWANVLLDGTIGRGHVLPEHHGKGFWKFMILKLAQDLQKIGITPLGQSDIDIGLVLESGSGHTKLQGTNTWLEYLPSKQYNKEG